MNLVRIWLESDAELIIYTGLVLTFPLSYSRTSLAYTFVTNPQLDHFYIFKMALIVQTY